MKKIISEEQEKRVYEHPLYYILLVVNEGASDIAYHQICILEWLKSKRATSEELNKFLCPLLTGKAHTMSDKKTCNLFNTQKGARLKPLLDWGLIRCYKDYETGKKIYELSDIVLEKIKQALIAKFEQWKTMSQIDYRNSVKAIV